MPKPNDNSKFVETGMVISRQELLIGNAIRILIITLAVIFAVFPILFVASSALNPTGQLSNQSLIPRNADLSNFRALLVDELELYPFWRWIGNSFLVATTSTILGVLITALSAYSFSRFRFRARRSMLLGILLIQVFPNLLALVAIYLIMLQINRLAEAIPQALPFLAGIDWSWIQFFGLGSHGGLILVYLGGAMGINTWLMKGFFDTIPREIDESALVDGASHWQIFWMLIFPLVRPILAVVAVLSFVGTFNEFVLARILLLRDKENWTLMVGLFNYISADFNRDWGKFAAGALVASVPVVLVYIALQDQIVGGLTAGSVKG
jgi:arabinogalactan oligomer / maltooligosaccharide transport system permease protein